MSIAFKVEIILMNFPFEEAKKRWGEREMKGVKGWKTPTEPVRQPGTTGIPPRSRSHFRHSGRCFRLNGSPAKRRRESTQRLFSDKSLRFDTSSVIENYESVSSV